MAMPALKAHPELPKTRRPRKHYKKYYCTRSADDDMRHCQQGLAAFLRAYFHYKSADWAGNDPYPLRSWTAEELAKMPTYYIMDRDLDMAQTVAPYMPSDDECAACSWLTEEELQTYVQEFSRTGFQGGLQWYRCGFNEEQILELRLFSGRTIDCLALSVASRTGVCIRYQVHLRKCRATPVPK